MIFHIAKQFKSFANASRRLIIPTIHNNNTSIKILINSQYRYFSKQTSNKENANSADDILSKSHTTTKTSSSQKQEKSTKTEKTPPQDSNNMSSSNNTQSSSTTNTGDATSTSIKTKASSSQKKKKTPKEDKISENKEKTSENEGHSQTNTTTTTSASFKKQEKASKEDKNPIDNKEAPYEKEIKTNVDVEKLLKSIKEEEQDSIFENNIQNISIALFRTTSSFDVLDMFEKYIDHKEYDIEEICLLFYFVCYHKNDIKDDPRFKKLLELIFLNMEKIPPSYLFSMTYCFGILSSTYNIKLDEPKQEKLSQMILDNVEEFQANQISSLAWAITQVYQSSETLKLMLRKFIEILLTNSHNITLLDYANLLISYSLGNIEDQEIIDKLIKSQVANLDYLEKDNDDPSIPSKIILTLGELSPITKIDHSVYETLFTRLVKPNLHKLSTDDASSLILFFSQTLKSPNNYVMQLLKVIYAGQTEITIDSYINVWLGIASLKNKPSDIDKTVKFLKETLFKQKLWDYKELSETEIINIIVAMATLKENDKDFLKFLIEIIEPNLSKLDKIDLLNLARAMVIYVKQYNEFYIKIHNQCVDRKDELTSEEKATLKETFTKARGYLPSSPFIEVKLY